MLIVLIIVAIFVGLLIAGIILKKKSNNIDKYDLDTTSTIFFAISATFGIIAGFVLIIALGTNKINSDVAHNTRVEQRESYVEILESNAYIYTDTDFYNSVLNFNYNVNMHERYANSLWTNWFETEEWKGIEPIDLDKYKE